MNELVKTKQSVPGTTENSEANTFKRKPPQPLHRLYQLSPWLGAAVISIGVQVSGLAQNLNLLVYDLVATQRSKTSAEALPITIIGITENDISKLGWRDTWAFVTKKGGQSPH